MIEKLECHITVEEILSYYTKTVEKDYKKSFRIVVLAVMVTFIYTPFLVAALIAIYLNWEEAHLFVAPLLFGMFFSWLYTFDASGNYKFYKYLKNNATMSEVIAGLCANEKYDDVMRFVYMANEHVFKTAYTTQDGELFCWFYSGEEEVLYRTFNFATIPDTSKAKSMYVDTNGIIVFT